MRKWIFIPLVLIIMLVGLELSRRGYIHPRFPYGVSHSCDIGLMLALDQYALDHGGVYPFGEATPKALLSLLYPQYADPSDLSGKTMPFEVTLAPLVRGQRLSRETCGWHYVEGRMLSDDKRLAIAWKKARLGHNGERTADGSTKVPLVGMNYKYVKTSEWSQFLAEQATRFRSRPRPALVSESAQGSDDRATTQLLPADHSLGTTSANRLVPLPL